MKAQILTIISILTLTSLSFAKECTPETLAGAWSRSDKMELPPLAHCGKSTYSFTDRYFLYNIDGIIQGHGFSDSLTTYTKCPGVRAQVQFPKVKLMNSKISIQDDVGDIREFRCDVTGDTLTIDEAVYTRAPGSQASASHNSAKTNEKTKAIEEMGNWAPAPQAPQAAKQGASPVQTTGNKAMGNWAPTSR